MQGQDYHQSEDLSHDCLKGSLLLFGYRFIWWFYGRCQGLKKLQPIFWEIQHTHIYGVQNLKYQLLRPTKLFQNLSINLLLTITLQLTLKRKLEIRKAMLKTFVFFTVSSPLSPVQQVSSHVI